MHEFVQGNIAALQHLDETTRQADLERGVALIAEAQAVYLVGLRRSFPVAAYLAYALRHTDKRTYLVDGLAGMIAEQSSMMGPGDLLIATSFRPYAQQTADIVNEAADRQGEGDRDQRQPAVAHRAPRRPLLRGQGRGVPQVPLVDGFALPRADARHQLRVPADRPRRRSPAGMKTFALFGAGRIGRIHAANIAAHADARLKYVVDVDAAAAAAIAAAAGAAVADTATVLADAGVDALLVASPTDTHAALIEAGAAAGKAILCEKPVDLDVGRARAAVAAAERAGILLAIGFNRRYDPSFRRIRQGIDDGEIGAVEIGADREPRPVAAAGRLRAALGRPVPRHDDPRPRHGALAARRGAGRGHGPRQLPGRPGDRRRGRHRHRCGDAAHRRRAHRAGREHPPRGVRLRPAHRGLRRARHAGRRQPQVDLASSARPPPATRRDPALPFFLERYADAYRLELDAFVRRLHGEAADIVSGADGVRALEIADACDRSLRTRATVLLESRA